MESNRSSQETGKADPSPVRTLTPEKILVCGALGTLLYVAHAAFIPLALASLFALVLSAPVEKLHARHIPRSVSASLILVVTFLALGGLGTWISIPAQEWFAKAPQTMAAVKQKVGPVAKFMNRIDDFRKSASNMTSSGHPGAAPPVTVTPQQSAPSLIVDATGTAVAGVLTFVIVTLFLLTGGPPMMARMGAAFSDRVNSAHVLMLIDKVRAQVGHFYLTTTLINLGLGTATALAMWACGMPTPYLWGALAAILNYIPYAGSATTLLVITLVAIVSFDTLGHVVGVAGSYVVLATIEGQVAQPLLVGRRMEVNPLLVFLGLWFGGLFWGIAGIVLATPTLVALKVIAENSKSSGPMLEFLGPNDQTPDRDGNLLKWVRRTT